MALQIISGTLTKDKNNPSDTLFQDPAGRVFCKIVPDKEEGWCWVTGIYNALPEIFVSFDKACEYAQTQYEEYVKKLVRVE